MSDDNTRGNDAISRPAKRLRTPTVWLDLLPLEICTRICSMLPLWKLRKDRERTYRDPQYDLDLDLFQLAAVSKTQCLATAAAQRHILRADRVNNFDQCRHLITSWYPILGTDIREVRLSSSVTYISGAVLHGLLSLPSIVKASIPNWSPMFKALREGGSVKRLKIEFTRIDTELRQDDEEFPGLLQSCRVEELSLVCNICVRHPPVACRAAHYMGLLKNRPKFHSLRSLDLFCRSKRLEKLVQAASILPNLEKLRLEHSFSGKVPLLALAAQEEVESPFRRGVPSDLEAFICSLQSVGLINCGPVDRLAPILGERVTAIASRETVSRTAIQRLEECPKLDSIDLMLAYGTEIHFPTILRSLRSLSLSWPVDVDHDPRQDFYTPDPDVLIGIVRRNNQMQELRLQNVTICHSVLQKILICIGDRLQSLQVPIPGGGKSSPDDVERITRLLMKHNPNVADLKFGSGALHDSEASESRGGSHVHHAFFDSEDDDDCNQRAPWKQVSVMCRVLKRRLPQLSDASIQEIQWWLRPCK